MTNSHITDIYFDPQHQNGNGNIDNEKPIKGKFHSLTQHSVSMRIWIELAIQC